MIADSKISFEALSGPAGTRVSDRNRELEALISSKLEEVTSALQAERLARVRLEQEVLKAVERERCRIGEDMHDDLGQQLTGIGLLAHLINTQLNTEAHPQAAMTAQLSAMCKNALKTVRSLAKSYFPVELETRGLEEALKDLAQRTEALAGIHCELRFEKGFHTDSGALIHLYRIAQESITNAIKHARPRAIVIEASAVNGMMAMTICDDGTGFTAPEPGKPSGMGLHLLQYRARLIGAEITIKRISESGGCEVACWWPAKFSGRC
jgi:signal transduction histidine kinase